MKVDVYHNPAKPGYRLLLPAGTSPTQHLEDRSSGVQLMQPMVLYTENIELAQITAGRVHAALRDALLLEERAFIADDEYGQQHRMRVDLYSSSALAHCYLALTSGRSVRPLVEDPKTGVAAMQPLAVVAKDVPLAVLCRPELLNTLYAEIEMLGGALVAARTTTSNGVTTML